jgi:hypothetical protein
MLACMRLGSVLSTKQEKPHQKKKQKKPQKSLNTVSSLNLKFSGSVSVILNAHGSRHEGLRMSCSMYT